MNITDIQDALCAPFHIQDIKWKPGATTKDKTKGLGMPYADARVYQDRLNEVCPGEWENDVSVLSAGNKVIAVCSLTICGITRTSTGEEEISDSNAATSAEAQAFKRAASMFGLGRYLYLVSRAVSWWEPVEQYKGFTDQGIANLNAKFIAYMNSQGITIPSYGNAVPPPTQNTQQQSAQASQTQQAHQAPPQQTQSAPPTQAPPVQNAPGAPTGQADTSWATRTMTSEEIQMMKDIKQETSIVENIELNFWARKYWDDVDQRIAGIKDAEGNDIQPYQYIRSDVKGFHDFVMSYLRKGR